MGKGNRTTLSEAPWRPNTYSKEGVFDIDKEDVGFEIYCATEISKESFEKVWDVVIDKYLLMECQIELDEEALINFGDLPELFSEEQLEYLSNTYKSFMNGLGDKHIKQILDYIAKKQG